MDRLKELESYIEEMHTAPTLEEMPRRSLVDKGIAGPTGAHVVEEVHTPFNLACITATTGSTAFQNIVGVTAPEIPDRVAASRKALELAGVKAGGHILFTYPPLVNVFPRQALEEFGLRWSFLRVSSRDALLLALCREQPDVVVGESSFLRAALEDGAKMGLGDLLPRGRVFLAAGTPLDPELAGTARRLADGVVHDLYGCQEFGWLTLDGIPLREDIALIPAGNDCFDLLVGGLPTGDRFPVLDSGHACNREGKIITHSRVRTAEELVTTIHRSTASGRDTVERLARTILRIKARIVRVAPDLALGADRTAVSVAPLDGGESIPVEGRTDLLDSLLRAQMDYQSQSKTDPAWIKRR